MSSPEQHHPTAAPHPTPEAPTRAPDRPQEFTPATQPSQAARAPNRDTGGAPAPRAPSGVAPPAANPPSDHASAVHVTPGAGAPGDTAPGGSANGTSPSHGTGAAGAGSEPDADGDPDGDFTSDAFRGRVAAMQAAASVLAGFALFLPSLVLSRGWPMLSWRFRLPLLFSLLCGLVAATCALDAAGFGGLRALVGIVWSDEYTKRHVRRYSLGRRPSVHDNIRAYRLAWGSFFLFLLTFGTTVTVLVIDQPPAAPAPAPCLVPSALPVTPAAPVVPVHAPAGGAQQALPARRGSSTSAAPAGAAASRPVR